MSVCGTRIELTHVPLGSGAGMDGVQHIGLSFLAAPLPETLIPQGARPLD